MLSNLYHSCTSREYIRRGPCCCCRFISLLSPRIIPAIPFFHTVTLPSCHAAILPRCQAAMLQCCHAAKLPHQHAAILPPCKPANWPPCQSATHCLAILSFCSPASLQPATQQICQPRAPPWCHKVVPYPAQWMLFFLPHYTTGSLSVCH
jgi:hypothetical protein